MGSLKNYEALDVLLAVISMKKSPVYIFNDTAGSVAYVSALRLKDRMDELVKSGALVVFLYTTEMHFINRSVEGPGDIEPVCYRDGYEWVYGLEAFRLKLAQLRKDEKQTKAKTGKEEK